MASSSRLGMMHSLRRNMASTRLCTARATASTIASTITARPARAFSTSRASSASPAMTTSTTSKLPGWKRGAGPTVLSQLDLSRRALHMSACTASKILTNVYSSSLNKRIQPNVVPARLLHLHEYQSKELMTKFSVRVQRGKVASSPEEAEKVAQELISMGAKELVIKAQIHAGGRGKGHFSNGFKGGVKLSKDPKEIREYAAKMLGNRLITHQTGPEGQHVAKVLIHESISFDRELYFCILMDRAYNGPVIVASQRGGMDIEEVAAKSPKDIFTEPIDITKGIQPSQTERVGKLLGFSGAALVDAQEQMKNLYELFIKSDATQVEINPLVVAKENGKVYCVDAKINFDDNASFRQEILFNQRDFSMEDQREVAASKYGLNYVGLDGNIGCMVNGAGLAMATMDIIKLYGGQPANFLDVGGGANEKQVEEAFKILTSDPKVKAILVNIFGGIMKCDTIAMGIINAARSINLKHPLVVRLAGTNVEKGNKLLAESGIEIFTATNLDDAAKQAVACLN